MAFRWYSRSALAGDPGGQNNLGACYEHGLGCVQSYPKAVKWYRLAEAQGIGTAAMNLGYCYLHGHGVPRDKFAALRLFRLAVERGENRAAKEVERLVRDREVVRITGSSNGPRPATVAACSGGHAVDPSLEARSQLLLRDGPPEHLRHSRVASTESPPGTPGRESPPPARPLDLSGARGERDEQKSAGTSGRPRIRYIDVTEAGKHFGLVGVVSVAPPPAPRDAERGGSCDDT